MTEKPGFGPITFQREVLQRELWEKQVAICRAVDKGPHLTTSIGGCHASGKTYVTSGLVPWFLMRYPQAIVLTIAPTLRQVKNFWGEVLPTIEKTRRQFGRLPEPGVLSWRIIDDLYALGFSAAKGVNAQGFHAAEVLIIVDEAVGITPDMWDAIEGIRAGGKVRIVRLFNPTVASGVPYDDFTRNRASVNCFRISAFDTPNLAGLTIEDLLAMNEDDLNVVKVPSLTRRRWVLEMYRKWGPLNPRYQSRVLGQFPAQSDNAVFNIAWIEAARREPTEDELKRAKETPGTFIQVGIDVAGPGDDETAGCARVNGIVVAREAWPDADPRGSVVRWLTGIEAKTGFPLGPVVVDTVGIGYNFALHLADQGFQVYGFNPSARPMDPERFLNGKAEQYFRLRDIYQDRYISHVAEAWDEDEAAQLSAILYQETSRGLIQVEPKDEARERGVQSPDRAEAKVMAFSRIIPKEQLIVYGAPQIISRV